jgi:hypothetical protein
MRNYFPLPIDREGVACMIATMHGREGVARMIATMHLARDTRLVPLLRAVRDHGATLLQYLHPQPIPELPTRIRTRPVIAIISDDLGTSYGPWAYDSRALRWLCERAGAFIIASALPPEEWYQRAADAALSRGAAIIVDTLRDEELAWMGHAAYFSPDAQLLIAGDRDGPIISAKQRLGGDWTFEVEIGGTPAGAVQ